MAYYYSEIDLGDNVEPAYRFPRCLVERKTRPVDTDRVVYYRTTARNAHNWVKNGFVHETLLWVEDGRIRRAGR